MASSGTADITLVEVMAADLQGIRVWPLVVDVTLAGWNVGSTAILSPYGLVTQSLADVTSGAAGTLAGTGLFGAWTDTTSTITLQANTVGDVGLTTADVGAAATGAVALAAASGIAVEDVTPANVTGVRVWPLVIDVALQDVVGGSTGMLFPNGDADITVGDVTSSATGVLPLVALYGAWTDNILSDIPLQANTFGDVGLNIADVGLTAPATLSLSGAGAITLGDTTIADGVITRQDPLVVVVDLEGAYMGAIATLSLSGQAAPTLAAVTSAATGTTALVALYGAWTDNITSVIPLQANTFGDVGVTVANVASAATGAIEITGTSTPTLAAVGLTADSNIVTADRQALSSLVVADVTTTATATLGRRGTFVRPLCAPVATPLTYQLAA